LNKLIFVTKTGHLIKIKIKQHIHLIETEQTFS